MTTNCETLEPLLARAAEAPDAWPLDDGERARLSAHLTSCESCRDALAAQTEVRALLAARPALDASSAFRVRVRQALEPEAGRAPSLAELLDFRRWTWRLVPVAAAMVVATAIGLATPLAETDADVVAMTEAAAELPVAAALYSTNVTDESLLALMLTASADDRLGAVPGEAR